jgi:hypothetical protein
VMEKPFVYLLVFNVFCIIYCTDMEHIKIYLCVRGYSAQFAVVCWYGLSIGWVHCAPSPMNCQQIHSFVHNFYCEGTGQHINIEEKKTAFTQVVR